MPHLRYNLPGERRYVRERLKEIGMGTVTSSMPSSADDSGSEDRTVSVKQPQGRCRLSPIPFPTLSNDRQLVGTWQAFLPALHVCIPNSASLPLDHVIFRSLFLCLIAGDNHLILRTPEEDVVLWTVSVATQLTPSP